MAAEHENVSGVRRTDDAREDTRIVIGVNLGIAVDTDVAAEGHVIQTEGPETTCVTEAQGSRRSTASRSRVRETNASDDEVIGEGRVAEVSLAAILDDHGRTAELRRRGRRETHGAVRSKGTGRLEKQRAREADVITREGRTLGTSRTRDVIVEADRAGTSQRCGQGRPGVGVGDEQCRRRGNRDRGASRDDAGAATELEDARGNRGCTGEGIGTREREDTVTDLGEGQLARSTVGQDAREVRSTQGRIERQRRRHATCHRVGYRGCLGTLSESREGLVEASQVEDGGTR